MKKLLSAILVVAMVVSLAACGGSSGGTASSQAAKSTAASSATAVSSQATPENLTAPAVLSWDIVNLQSAIPALCLTIQNNNSVAIDGNFVVTFLKDGKEIKKSQDRSFICIAPGDKYLTFDNWEIPQDATDVKVEFSYIEKSYYEPVAVTYKEKSKTNDRLDLTVTIDDDVYSSGVAVKFKTGDKANAYGYEYIFDKGTSDISIETYGYDNYEVYFNAMKVKK